MSLVKYGCIVAIGKPADRGRRIDSIWAFFTARAASPTGGKDIYLYEYVLAAMSGRQTRVAMAAVNAAEATQRASLQATRFFTQALMWSPLFAARVISQATLLAFGLVEQQSALAKQPIDKFVKPPSSTALGAANASLVTTADNAAPAAELKTIGDVAGAIAKAADDAAPALATMADDDAQALAATADDAAPALVATDHEDQEIQLRAERLVVNKQRVRHCEVRVRKQIVTEIRSIDVPVSHEELVINRHAVPVDVEGEPIADETIHIPLEEKVNLTKETVVREEVDLGKRRADDVEHISDTLRYDELRVDCATTNPAAPGPNIEKLVPADNTVPARVTMLGPTTASTAIEQGTLHERIQNRAYALWEGEGRSEGRQLDHWAQAEREIFAMLTPSTDLSSVLRHAA